MLAALEVRAHDYRSQTLKYVLAEAAMEYYPDI
jgi:hypothetical protein